MNALSTFPVKADRHNHSKMFGKKQTIDQFGRKVAHDMKVDSRHMDRDIAEAERDQQKLTAEIKAAAKRGDKKTCQILAKQYVKSKNLIDRLKTQKAQSQSMQYQV